MPSIELGSPSDSAVLAAESSSERRSSGQMPRNKIGRYDLIQKLGAGEMGNVYRARQWGIDRDVVIKVLPKRLQEDEGYLERFYDGAKAAGKLQHINIVKAIDVGLSETGHHYFVMEFVEGKNINELFEHVSSFEERRAVGIIIQVTRALIHADARGMSHGDVRPENIHLARGEVVKLAGLGLAKELVDNSPHQTRVTLIAAHYVSPEEVRGDARDIRSDIFSLGASLYHMITGEMPFDGESAVEVLAHRLSGQLRSPRQFNRSISAKLCHVLERMLARNPEDRFQAPQDLLDELERVLDGSEMMTERIDSSKTCLERDEETRASAAVQPAVTVRPPTRVADQITRIHRRSKPEKGRSARRHSRPKIQVAGRRRRGQGIKAFVVGLGLGGVMISGLVLAYFHFCS